MASRPQYIEKDILFHVSKGDEHSFTRLVDHYWNMVYSQAITYTKCSNRSQEITQDVFLKIWHLREKLLEVKSFKNYLFILARNQIISEMRKRLEQFQEDDSLEFLESAIRPDSQLDYKETYSIIMQGIEMLPPVRRAIFKMSRMDGMSYKDIATARNISPDTVKEHIVNALNFLRTFVSYKNKLVFLSFYYIFV